MLVTSTIFQLLFLTASSELAVKERSPRNNLSLCLKHIIQKNLNKSNKITYIRLDDDDDYFLQDLYALKGVSVKKLPYHSNRINYAYFIATKDDLIFSKVLYLNQEKTWNPTTRFIIVIKHLRDTKLNAIFDILLRLRVANVIVVNGTDTAEVYSYNPYENNACGNFYTRIIEYGKCLQVSDDLYPLKANIDNCFFRVAVPHSPPFTWDPSFDNQTHPLGIEENLIQMLSEVENFKYNISYNYNAETVSTVANNMSVTGPLMLLQNNETDILLGGMFLSSIRAAKFSYVHGYLDNVDEIRVFVKRAVLVPPWMIPYRVFLPEVWAMILIFMFIYTVSMIILLKSRSNCHVVMILLDNLVQHGSHLKFRKIERIFLIIWVWFVYFLYCFYTSRLVSLITKPSLEYQISNVDDLLKHGLLPCFSPVMRGYNDGDHFDEGIFEPPKQKTCYTTSIFDSLQKVSKSTSLFTVAPLIDYVYHEPTFRNEFGDPLVYMFDQKQADIIYAIYFDKGFPGVHWLRTWALRIRESGFITKSFQDHIYLQQLKYPARFEGFKSRGNFPWRIWTFGIFTSCITFSIEIFIKHKNSIVKFFHVVHRVSKRICNRNQKRLSPNAAVQDGILDHIKT